MKKSFKDVNFFDFKDKYKKYKKDIDKSIKRVFENGWFILGPEVASFENKFAKFLGIQKVIGVNSGTDAIFLALKALGIKEGDEVITVANTAVPTISAIRMTGAKPVFVDVDEETQNIDVGLIENKINSKTKVILPVHLYGYPANMDTIMKIAKKYKLFVVEDACQAHGAVFGSKFVGTIGDAGCFSFYPTKNLGGMGDGGAIVTNNSDLASKVRAMRNYGEISKFNNKIEGINSRLDEIQASILSWGLTKLDAWNKKRDQLANIYLSELAALPIQLPPKSKNKSGRVWHLFVIKTEKRDQLSEFLKKNGIGSMIHYPKPIFDQEAYAFLGYKQSDLPVVKKLASQILSLPLYPELSAGDVKKVCRVIKKFVSFKN